MDRRRASLAGVSAAAALLCAGSAPAAEILQNGSFASDELSWLTTVGEMYVGITGAHTHSWTVPGDLMPRTGATYLSNFTSDPFFGHLTGNPGDVITAIYQSFTIANPGVFSGTVAWLGRDEAPYNDFAWVRIYEGSGFHLDAAYQEVFYRDILTQGDYAATPWTSFSLAIAPGDYTIVAAVGEGGEVGAPSQLLIDGVSVQAPIPEPATWALMIGGFFGLGAALRRRRRAAAA